MTDKKKETKAEVQKELRPFFNEHRSQSLEKEALNWAGTPYLPNTMLRGRGVDCCRLPFALYQSIGLVSPKTVLPEYKAFQDGKRSQTLLADQLETLGFAKEPNKAMKKGKEGDVFAPPCGSLLVFEIGRERKLHLGLALTSGFLHVMPNRPARREGITKAWVKRVVAVWTPFVQV